MSYIVRNKENGIYLDVKIEDLNEEVFEECDLYSISKIEKDNFREEIRNDEHRTFNQRMILYWDAHLEVFFSKKRDIQIADALLELFRRAEYIENFNKKSLYLLVREMTGYPTHYITKVVNKMIF
jgi:hypothetical protein